MGKILFCLVTENVYGTDCTVPSRKLLAMFDWFFIDIENLNVDIDFVITEIL